ncbi:uncharacterized protein LOC113861566 [Abrus precatorius]|uniref:rRNA N-glycosylase n=1 Tax=Abrus precatorius TaxID=3816 RepID=A0A8B8L267_ABRPR|nr:uncharacterized protein LOC113861566 [Abrus precatorius]XP_027350281.1 uncharacterized protein LOC113861566 [Abrus precatorius]
MSAGSSKQKPGPSKQKPPREPDFTERFEVQPRNNNQYHQFIARVRQRVVPNPPDPTSTPHYTHGLPALLPEQTNRSEIRLFDLVLGANDQDGNHHTVRLRFRRDNLYLIGYQMENGQWLELDNENHEHLITDAEWLPFDGSYGGLGAAAVEKKKAADEKKKAADEKKKAADENTQEHMGVEDIAVGSESLRNAVTQLATSEADHIRARSLMAIIVMTSEALRLNHVQQFAEENYERGRTIRQGMNGRDSRFTQLEDEIKDWSHLSKTLFFLDACPSKPNSNNVYQSGGKESTYQSALQIINQWRGIQIIIALLGIVKYFCFKPPPSEPRPRKPRAAVEDGGDDGQCIVIGSELLEVFSIRIDNNYTYAREIYGIITATDALRTQIIYNSSKDNPEYINPGPNDVLLSGPSEEAISALGEVTIQFLLKEKGRNDGKEVILQQGLYWSSFKFGNVYDKPTSKAFNIDGGRLIIKYGVSRHAAAAKVNISKFQGGENTSEVYGKVSCLAGWNGADATSILFQREKGDRVTVNRGELIPLSRSIVVVPLSSSTLKVTVQVNHHNMIFPDVELANDTIQLETKESGSDQRAIQEKDPAFFTPDDSVLLMVVDWATPI